jgi:predicted MFS family arabinose efflux permease
MEQNQTIPLTGYQKLVIFMLAITQFTVILDFMVMSPLGDILMKSMDMHTSQFGVAVSAYAFSAGISGLLTAGFADKFDRKKLLLFFYVGFVAGTILCGLVNSYEALVAARIFTGLFGGVIGSISMAIVADIFSLQQRGRVMGFLQMGFGASQVLGIPIGLYLANAWGWHAPFLWIGGMAALITLLILFRLKPVNAHLAIPQEKSPLLHLWHTVQKSDYRVGFAATALLSIGGFMIMPFGSAFSINNLKITQEQLPIVYVCAGVVTLFIMPVMGILSDKIDRFRLFTMACLWMVAVMIVYTHLGPTPLAVVIGINILMMIGVMGRMVPSTAMVSGVPDMVDRGAFMSINSSLQQISGGIGAAVGGLIVYQKSKHSPIQHYDTLGFIVAGITIISILLMMRVDKMIKRKIALQKLDGITAAPDEVTVVTEM